MNFPQMIQQVLEDKKAERVICLDVKERFPLVDSFVIAQGQSSRHLVALCDDLIDLARSCKQPYNVHGREERTSWIVLDLSTVFVHLFSPERRREYNLEGLWGVGDLPVRKPVEIQIGVSVE